MPEIVYKRPALYPKQKAAIYEPKRLSLIEISKTAKLPGFRPGKVPMNVIEQRHGEAARRGALVVGGVRVRGSR